MNYIAAFIFYYAKCKLSRDVINNTLLEKVCEIATLARRNP